MTTTTSEFSKRYTAVEEDLALLSRAHNYRAWLFSLIRPYLGQRVLEIGSGIGNYSVFLLDRSRLWLSDYDPAYVAMLKVHFHSYRHVSCHLLDLATLDERILAAMAGMDTVLLMNVLEHVDDDVQALQILSRQLQTNGQIIIQVPGLKVLFGSLDEAYGHCRRYNRAEVHRLTEATGLELVEARYYNFLTVPSWFWLARITRQDRLPSRSVRLFDQLLVPFVSRLERWVHPPFGSSMLIVLRKV